MVIDKDLRLGVVMDRDWIKTAIVYQIYPRSFCDSNGDGIGDIQGIISKLGYLKDLGINVIWLSPVYKSPNHDNGYDISDYYAVNSEFGTMDDMAELFKKAKALDIRIIMDLVINHTSDEHEWFKKSRDINSPYHDYYIWHEGIDGEKPNNWTGFFGEGCWEKDEQAGKYFLHLFSKKMPDLNFHNRQVIEEIKKIMRYWLDLGIDGFRCDVINVIFKQSLEDGKKRIAVTGREHYLSTEGCHDILKELRRDVLDNYDCFAVGETVMVTTKMANDLCGKDRNELDMVFSFAHMEVDQINNKWFKIKFRPERFFNVLTKWQNELDWNANYLENHDQPRSVSRFGDDKKYRYQSATMLATMLFSLRGTPYIYEGQEIGMTNGDFRHMFEIKDTESHNIHNLSKKLHFPKKLRRALIRKTSRDNARTPMQWTGKKNAGFTDGKPWLKINSNYRRINVETDLNNKNSIINYYKRLIDLRKTDETLINGSFKRIETEKDVFGFEREYKGDILVTICNFSGSAKMVDDIAGDVLISNYGRKSAGEITELQPYEAIIIRKH